MKKNVTKKSRKEKVFSNNDVMSLLENMSDGIEIIAEAQEGTQKSVVAIEKRLDKMDKKFDKIDKKFDKIDKRFDKIDGKIDTMQSDITDIKFKVDKKVSYDDFKKLEKRVLHLERIATH